MKKQLIQENLFFDMNNTEVIPTHYNNLEESEDLYGGANTSMTHLSVLNQHSKLKEEFKKRLKIALQKIGSSNKTKAIHQLITNNKCQIGYGAIDYINLKQLPGAAYIEGKKLQSIVIDLNFINTELSRSEMITKVKRLQTLLKEKENNLTKIDDLSEFRLQKIESNIVLTIEEILNGIDYIKAVDTYYYIYLTRLTRLSYSSKGKEKIFLLGKDIFDTIVERSLLGLNLNEDRYEEVKLMVNFLFMKQYLGINNNKIRSNLNKTFGKTKVDEFFEPESHTKIKMDDYSNMFDMGKLLTLKEIINITNSAFKQRIKNIAGDKLENSLELSFSDFVAYLISCLYPGDLFNAPIIDKERQQRLEKLVLNFKSNLVIKG